MLLPLQGLGACLMHAIDHQPQPLPEMCDSVLLNCGCVSISVVVSFDMALIGVWLGVLGLTALIWHVWLGAAIDVRMFDLIPDPPPPRTIPF